MRQKNTAGCGGSALAALIGTITALLVWASSRRTHQHMGGGFEGKGEDASVLWTELPLVLLAGAAIPVAVWLLALRLLRAGGAPARTGGARTARVLIAAVCAFLALAVSAWRLHTSSWANPPSTRMSHSAPSELHP